jgi:hypothetical protein
MLQLVTVVEVFTGVDSLVTQFFFDSQQLVQLSQSFGSSWSTSLDLTSSQTDNQVSNESVFSFTRSVGNHNTPVGSERVLSSLDGFRQGTDLVNLQQQSVSSLLFDGGSNSSWVGDSQVISNNLDTSGLEEVRLSFPVIFSKWIFDGDNWVSLHQGVVHVS